MKNLPNFEFISCRISVVASTVVGALRRRQVGHWNCSQRAVVVADKRCLMPERCNCEKVGQHDVLDSGIDFAEVDFGQAELGAGEFFVLQLRPRQRLSCEVQLVYC